MTTSYLLGVAELRLGRQVDPVFLLYVLVGLVGLGTLSARLGGALRDGGLVVYQASWGPANAMPGARLFSTFAVVRNPADPWPLIACLVIAAGLAYHFVRKLHRYVRAEARPA